MHKFTSYDVLKAKNEVLLAALALKADPTDDLKRAALALALEHPALPSNSVQGAIAKAFTAPRAPNLIPAILEARKAKPRGPEHFVNVERGRERWPR